jgi:hypothetical protein
LCSSQNGRSPLEVWNLFKGAKSTLVETVDPVTRDGEVATNAFRSFQQAEYCLQLLDCSPEQAIFIDDREANVAAARNEGIISLLYRSTDQLRLDLEAIGFDVLPAQATAAS